MRLDNAAPLEAGRHRDDAPLRSARGRRLQRPRAPFARDYGALPLTLEARFGFNARLGSSFDASADEEVFDASYSALGRVFGNWNLRATRWASSSSTAGSVECAPWPPRTRSTRNTASPAHGSLRAFSRGAAERLDLFVNLRIGLAMQHLDALGTRQDSASITTCPPRASRAARGMAPGIGLGAALGMPDYRLGRHFAFVTRLDAAGERLNGAELGTCADGIGSVTTVAGTVGLAFEFKETREALGVD